MNTNNSVDEGYRNMLSRFRYNDLQTLLGAFGQNKVAQKSELTERAIELLRTTPANVDYLSYTTKIYEIYLSLPHDMSRRDDTLRRLSQTGHQQPQQPQQITSSTGQIQNIPQCPQQSMNMAQAGLPQVMPEMQRDMYGNHISNSIPINNMVNYSIHYLSAGNYQPSGTHTIVSHQLPQNQQMSIVAQDALRLGTTSRRNNSYTPSIETVAQIIFKKQLPFYEVIDEVIKPTLLTGTDGCTLRNAPRDTKEAEFKFQLSVEHANSVIANCDFSHGQNDYHYQLQIRICQLIEPVPNESTDFMPLGLTIRVCKNGCTLPPFDAFDPYTRPTPSSRRIGRPINCTEFVKLYPNANNNIIINWTPDGKNYVFALYLVKKTMVDTLINKLQVKGGKSSEETKNDIIKKSTDVDPDLATTSYRFSLMCPLGKMRMEIPAKSIHCNHLQCFDASNFILMNEKTQTWICPICNGPCFFDDIQIENYFLEVISSPILTNCNEEIDILADGTWRVCEKTEETINTKNTQEKVKPIVYVDLDSDDEKSIEPNTEPIAESSRTQEPENFKSSLIDLTLSNEEEPPTKKVKLENEAQAAGAIQPVAVVDLKPQGQVQRRRAFSSFEQGVVIEIDSPSPPSSPTPTTKAS